LKQGIIYERCFTNIKKRLKFSDVTDAETKAEADAGTDAEAKSETDAEIKAEAKSETDAEIKAEAKSETDAEIKAEAKPETGAEAKAEAEAKSETGAEVKAEAKSEKDADTKAEATEKNENNKKKSKKKAIIWLAVAAVCLVVAVVFGVNFILTRQAINRQDAIREAGLSEPSRNPVAGVTPDITYTPDPPEVPDESSIVDPDRVLPDIIVRTKPSKPNEREINFEALWEINEDVVAWIEIPGTVIDYPIVSTLCNQHYIDHDLTGRRTGYGALFTDMRNHPNWQDPYIIVYGHNMRDGRKFSDLHLYRGQRFFNENRIIHIYTPEGQFDYEIFAAFERDHEHLMLGWNFRERSSMRAYLENLATTEWAHAIIDMDGVTEEDNFLVLSTCVGWGDRRFIIHATFIHPESAAAQVPVS
jgi:sortase B